MRKRNVAIIFLLIFFGVVVISILTIYNSTYYQKWRPMEFDKSAWNAENTGSWGRDYNRHRMAEGLISGRALHNLTRFDVEALLGPPLDTMYYQDWDMVYILGPERTIGVDNEWLVINLNENSKVTEYKIVMD